MTFAAGTRLGAYEIIGSLGAGGMGEVYRARDTKLARDVALKVVPPLFAHDPERLARFTREAQTLAALSHPNIAHIYGFEDISGYRALVMEFVEGDDLSVLIARGPMPASEVLPIARQIADGLECAHELGIIHRDLKPANIKVRPDGGVKILDFGLAKALGGDADLSSPDAMQLPTLTARPTQVGVILGTPAYMAPEQARGKAVDRRADIWAFGVIVYEMLTGTRLFTGATTPETLAHVITREVDLRSLPPATPAPLRSLVSRCLVKDPRLRLRDIGDARLALECDVVDGGTAGGWRTWPWRETAAWTLAGFLAVTAGYLAWSRSDAAPASAPLRLGIELDVTTLVGTLSIALAPDGRALVIQAPWNSRDTRLRLRRMDTMTTEPLPGTEGGHTPFWSADGQSIAFVSDGQLRRLDLQTSTVRPLCPAPQALGGGAWAADGTILFGGLSGPLSRVPAGGGAVVAGTLDTSVGEIAQTRPLFLPDGKRFIYLSRRSDGSTRTMLARLDADSRRELTGDGPRPVWAGSDWLLYRRGEALYAQRADYERPALIGEPAVIATHLDVASASGTRETVAGNGIVAVIGHADRRRQFTWYDRDGGGQQAVGPLGEYTTFDLSHDGRRVVAALRGGSSSNLWTIDTANGTTTPMTVGEVIDVDPRWSPDSRTVMFSSLRDPARSPFSVRSNGEPPTLAWKFEGRLFALDDWSQDGRWVLHHDTSTPVLQARLIAPASGRKEGDVVAVARALTGTIDQARMSPDNNWVAYNSNESGRYEVMVVPFPPTGERFQVSRNGGVQPMWRADGGELYFLALDGTLMALPVTGPMSFSSVAAKPLFQPHVLTPTAEIEQYAPNHDGTRFLVLDFAGQFKPPVVEVLSNWRALVDRPSR